MDDNSLAHTKWKCQYHIVFIPKYRKKVLFGKLKAEAQDIIRTLCRYKKVEIVSGAICSDHVHLCLSIPPKLSIAEFMGYLKGKSALMIYDRHPELGSKWDRSFGREGTMFPQSEMSMKKPSRNISKSRKRNPTTKAERLSSLF